VQTLLYVTDMHLGDELEVRRIHEAFPIEELDAGIGVERVAVFIGSGKFALEITVGDGDFHERFHHFLSTPRIKAFFSELSAHIENLPSANDQTGDMPLLTQMLTWRSSNVDEAPIG